LALSKRARAGRALMALAALAAGIAPWFLAVAAMMH
jgi:hypothetical protein